PLDVGCFSPLKTAYRRQVEKLIRNRFNYITKLEFLSAFRDAFDALITEIPFDPDEVTWQSKTLKNYHEFGSQMKLITDKLGSSFFSLKDRYQQLIVLIRDHVAELEQRKKKRIQKERDPTTASSSSKKESSSNENGTITDGTIK
ncbi:hypothetical protein K469DRAFT_719509, partial [Zopfia rhizophila CBS 207.26]